MSYGMDRAMKRSEQVMVFAFDLSKLFVGEPR